MVKVEHLKHARKTNLKFDLDSQVKSKLPEEVRDMMGDLINVGMYIEAYKAIGSDVDAVPFGRIRRKDVERAKEILDDLEG